MKVHRIASLSPLLVLLAVFTGCGGFKGVVTPTLTSISPATVAAGSQGFTLTATGTNFVSGTQILWNGVAQSTKVVSNTQLTTGVTAAQIASAGSATIRVIKPDTTTSDAMTLTITGSSSQTFSLTSINPYTVAAGSAAFTLTATGVGFASGDSITWNGTAIATSVDSSTQLHATVPAANVVTAGTILIAVQDASNNKTNQLPFIVTGGAAGTPPTLTSLSPNTSFNNVASVALTANGTGFLSNSVIVWAGTAMPTTFVSATQLTTTIPAAFLTTVGTENVFVLNPDSTVSNTLPFTITVNPATTPTLTSISPTKSAVGDPGFTLTLNGTNFATGCVAYFGATALPTTVVSSTQLTAQVPASALTAVAEIPVTAKNAQSNPSNPIPYLVGMNIFFGEVNDLVWDSARNIMYISQPSTSTKNPNTVVAIDPVSLAIQWTYSPGSGSEPDHLALSADKKYLYVGLDGKGTVERLILGNQQGVPDISIPLGSDPNLGAYYAMDVEVDPVQSTTIAVARGVLPSVSIVQAAGGVAIYDNATQRPSVISPTTQAGNVLLDTIQWSNDGTAVYAANNENFEADFYQLSVSANGVSLVSDHQNFFPVPNLRVHLDSTTQLLYGDDGLVVNPSTAAQSGNFVSSGVMTTDAALNRAYFVGQSAADIQTVAYEVESFNLTSFSAAAQLPLYQVNGLPQHIVRWGSNGLAFVTKRVTNCVVSPCNIQDGRMYVIFGPFVTQ
ncbi:IPT/TIG domain-containing protein [Telmatobacter sp. DSM 110680]|uniref:IPT/TIG domain-containing protein n=1 Tax=Telmatobacter sp. DSM 110680 TaxID=3036704 RepID=A0AAU7DDM9_9BACT